MKLQVKVTLFVTAILLVLGVISTGALLYYQRQHAQQLFQESAGSIAGAVRGSLEQNMLTGDSKFVQDALVSIAKTEFISEASVVAPNGTIAASSSRDNIGKTTTDAQLFKVLKTGTASSAFLTQKDSEVLQTFTPVFNQPECQPCHGQQQRALGVIEIDLKTDTLATHLRFETILIIILGLATFLFIGGCLAFMLRKTVLNRLSGLARTARKLSEGNYAARSSITGRDEIGELSNAFNDMAASVERHSRELERSQQQLVELNSSLEERVKSRTQELSSMNALLSRLSRSLSPKTMLEDALNNIRTLTNVEVGLIHVVDRSGTGLVRIADFGLNSNRLSDSARLKLDEMAKKFMLLSSPIELNDINNSQEYGEFRSLVILPLKSKTTLGVLTLASFSPNRFQAETLRLLKAMCDAISIALENANVARDLEELNAIREQLLEKLISAQEEERRRIARELHDEASQSLAALAVNLEDVADALPDEYKETRRKLDVLQERTVSTLLGIRSLALELRPSALDDLGLLAAIDWYAKDLAKKWGWEIQVRILGQKTKLPAYTETMLFRIVQESLTNIARHAKATRVELELSFRVTEVALRIEDNGKGFDYNAIMSKGEMRQNLGLHGMKERAALLGGTLEIQSQSGKGTVILVTVPTGNNNGYHE